MVRNGAGHVIEKETGKAVFNATLDVEGVREGEEIRWMRTGDQAVMDEDGYVKITGRIKDIIIR